MYDKSTQYRAKSGKKLPSKKTLEIDSPSSKGWWESSHGKMLYDSDAKDLTNAAKENIDCYGGPGAGREGKPKTGNSPRPDMRGSPKPHVYRPGVDNDDGM
jgi:hypothetical protein